MITALSYLETSSTDPYRNLAAEKLLTLGVREGECILFLWQNEPTVVIGRNQNAFEECSVARLREEGVHLARRLSGGGAVYHDLGNLNFTFAVRKPDYDPDRQSGVVLRAAQLLGIPAEKSGRNDLETGGRKFSGNAYYETRGHCCHHGTLMLSVNLDHLEKYLTVSGAKLRSRGVASVRSRVVNLKELCPKITTDRVKAAVLEAFGEVYGLPVASLGRHDLPAPAQELPAGRNVPEDVLPSSGLPARLRRQDLLEEAAAFASESWLFPPRLPFTAALEGRFSWGGVRLEFSVRGDHVLSAECLSDAMDERLIRRLGEALRDCPYSGQALAARVQAVAREEEDAVMGQPLRQKAGEDIAELIRGEIADMPGRALQGIRWKETARGG